MNHTTRKNQYGESGKHRKNRRNGRLRLLLLSVLLICGLCSGLTGGAESAAWTEADGQTKSGAQAEADGQAESAEQTESEEEVLQILYFHNNPCGACHPTEDFIQMVKELFGEDGAPFEYEITGDYAYGTQGAALVKEIEERFGIIDKDMLYPTVVINDSYLSGNTAVTEGILELMLREAGVASAETAGTDDAEGSEADAGTDGTVSSEMDARADRAEDSNSEANTGADDAESSETDAGADSAVDSEPDAEIVVHYYETTACESCEAADEAVEALPSTVSIDGTEYAVVVERKNITEGDNASELTGYFERYEVPSAKQYVPIVFVGSSYLSGEDAIVKGLSELLESAEAIAAEPGDAVSGDTGEEPDEVASEESGDAASGEVGDVASEESGEETENAGETEKEEETESVGAADAGEETEGGTFLYTVGIWGVLSTGFLNGFNPCSLSMTILFLSLVVGRKDFLRCGLTFLAGKYAAYVSLGLAVSMAAASIPASAFGVASTVINVILLVLCLLLGVGNFLDFLNARKGEYGKIRVQLPVGLRRWNHKMIKRMAGETVLLPLVFIGSVAVSLGEFFCTGQIYLASILRWIDQANGGAVPVTVFCIYVAMLCVPALVIIILLVFGKSVLTISDQALRQTPAVKLLNAIFFAVFAVLAIKMLL